MTKPVPAGKHSIRLRALFAAALGIALTGGVTAPSKDWTKDPRVTDANGNGYIDPEDLIAAFSDCTDHDHNGYVNDISGWDFYDNQNDPATPDTTYDHSDGQMGVLLHECPKCMILPVKAGAEALDRTDDLAKAWLFSADAGASVVTSVTGELGYSSFMREAI